MEKSRQFYYLNGVSGHVTLFQLMDSILNINHAVIIFDKWIFDSNFKKALPLLVESLKLICSSSGWLKLFTPFDPVFYAVSFINPKGKNKKWYKVQIMLHVGGKDWNIYIYIWWAWKNEWWGISTVNKLVLLKTRLQWISMKHPLKYIIIH